MKSVSQNTKSKFQPTTMAIAALCLATQTYASFAMAMPESRITSHSGNVITNTILSTNAQVTASSQGKLSREKINQAVTNAVAASFSKTLIPELDHLWDSRKDIYSCSRQTPTQCRVLSVFRSEGVIPAIPSATEHPIVLMPGFTGYRKMYLEQIYDLLQAGYGPVYISDFVGSGESFKEELKPGEQSPSVAQVISDSGSITDIFGGGVKSAFKNEVTKAAGSNANFVATIIGQLPLGMGYIEDFDDYQDDVDFVMNHAVNDNPGRKIVVSSLSMTGLVLAISIGNQDKNPTWISHVDRFVFESPMIRTNASNFMGLGFIPEFLSGLGDILLKKKFLAAGKSVPEFADKALAIYNPKNSISHSPNRLALTDSIRVWNKHETGGATFGWSNEEISHQYVSGLFDSRRIATDILNNHVPEIARVLERNHIPVVVAASKSDGLVDTGATKEFLTDIAGHSDNVELHFCTFETSRHVMDQESDHYRESYMAMLIDQKSGIVRPSYGIAPRNELLNCQTIP